MNHPHPRRRPAVAWTTRAALTGAAIIAAGCTLTAAPSDPPGAKAKVTPLTPPTGVLPAPPKLKAALDRIVRDGAPGIVVRVRHGNNVATLTSGVGTKAKGTAAAVPARANDHFRIASQTKPFVATVLLQLVAEGKVSLTDRVDKLLPNVLPSGTSVTVQQILNHTSGLRDYLNDARKANRADVANPVLQPYFGDKNVNKVWMPEDLVGKAPKPLLPNRNATARRFHYTNTNYVLAGMIITKVTGNPPGAEIKRRILDPLGMKETSFPTTSITLPDPYLHGYELGLPPASKWPDGNDMSRLSPSIFAGAGAMVSTTADLATFFRNLVSAKGTLLPKAQRDAMRTVVAVDKSSSYGLGIEKAPSNCGTAWGHNGSAFGYLSETLVTDDDQNETEIVVNANWDSKKNKTLTKDWAAILGLALCGETGTPLVRTPDLGETVLAFDDTAPAGDGS